MADRSQQGIRKRTTTLKQMDEAYLGQMFDIVRQVHLPKDQCFLNRFGQRGRHGYVLRNRETGEQEVVGWFLLKRIHDQYLGVQLPSRRVHRRDAGESHLSSPK